MPTRPPQPSLFDDDDGRALTVSDALPRGKPADRRQAAFQRLTRQIEAERTRLGEWQDYQTRYAQRVSEELMPLSSRLRKARTDLLRLLDEQYHRPGVLPGKHQRRRLRGMIIDLAQALLAEAADPELVALHDRHSDVSHAEQAELEREFSHAMMEQMFGVELDPAREGEGTDDLEALLEQALRKAQEEEQAREEKRARRRKSAKAAAAEAKRAEAETRISQSVREVYRKLASALHPDRASADFSPARKTELMQRVNRAYEAGDLLELLNVQLEIEQIDAGHLANLSAERLDHYNQVLRGQLAELKAEVESLVAPFRMLVPFAPNLRHGDVERALDGEIARMTIEVKQVSHDLEDLRDPKTLARVVKQYRPDEVGPDEVDDLAVLDALMEGFAPARRRRR